MTQLENDADLEEVQAITKTAYKKKWQETHTNYKTDSYHRLNRGEQVTIFRLRTGHNRLKQHMHNKLKIGESPTCRCGQSPETASHILQNCPLYDAAREQIWDDQTTPNTKLYGNTEDLRQTVQFIQATGLEI